MDLFAVVEQARKDIIQRASLIELRDAIRTAERCGDNVSAEIFRAEIKRRTEGE